MSYDKLSLASFQASLKEGKYQSATGARRAVGKATTLSNADKDKARKAIDAHFGADAKPAPKKAAVKKTAASKKVAAAAPKKTAAKAAPKKAASKAAPAKRTPATSVPQPPASLPSLDIENLGSIGTQVRLAEKTIQNAGAALNAVTQAKKECPDADLAGVMEEIGLTISESVAIFRQVVQSIPRVPAAKKSTRAQQAQAPQEQAVTPPQNGIVNAGVPSRAESLFRESAPGESSETAQG